MRSLLSEWERQRKTEAALQLVPLRDDLEWFLAGGPDPDISVDFFVLCADAASAAEISSYLLEFSKNYPATFLLSGWVDAFIGRIIRDDKDLGQTFIKKYWKPRRPANSRNQAYQALALVKGKHRIHWLNAAFWMQNFRNRSHSDRQTDAVFIKRAVKKYRERPEYVHCECLPEEYLEQVAATVLDRHHDAPRSVVYAEALARSFGISLSTLDHVRARTNKRAHQDLKR
jgi:hypothetical protein